MAKVDPHENNNIPRIQIKLATGYLKV